MSDVMQALRDAINRLDFSVFSSDPDEDRNARAAVDAALAAVEAEMAHWQRLTQDAIVQAADAEERAEAAEHERDARPTLDQCRAAVFNQSAQVGSALSEAGARVAWSAIEGILRPPQAAKARVAQDDGVARGVQQASDAAS